jgi:hypothetical protein
MQECPYTKTFAQCKNKVSCKYEFDINLMIKALNWISIQTFGVYCRFMKKRLNEHIRCKDFKVDGLGCFFKYN